MVFQDGALFDSLSVWENVAYYLLENSKMPLNEIGDKAIQMLGFVGLDADEIMYKLPEHLSGGMQRRVAIGRALLSTDPSLMLYDEPTTGLDPQAAEKILQLIMKLQSEKELSTIVVTHQIADAICVADRFIVIVDGVLAFDGNLEELRDSKDIRVMKFLEPFKASIEDVKKKNFIT
jgi:phospholipid/cholesterol/gamma-HCH transport system ATP-binding protein